MNREQIEKIRAHHLKNREDGREQIGSPDQIAFTKEMRENISNGQPISETIRRYRDKLRNQT